jgi:hypothetical protein
VLNVTTLASTTYAQMIDTMEEDTTKRYMHHYNAPGYSSGEVKPMRTPGRREIGHGALAERALLPVIPAVEDFPYTIRTVSEVLSAERFKFDGIGLWLNSLADGCGGADRQTGSRNCDGSGDRP